ncbi:MAG TPA: rhomboid family intramembrane serine protease [Thermoanaerobaculia bacterium]|nr:rhomboid family intramembrane serine protease [Thermoanaerobaculia bacterium]
MIPIRQSPAAPGKPWGTRILLAAILFVFLIQLMLIDRATQLIQAWGFVPARLFESGDWIGGLATVFTSLFLHGSIVHLAGNMLYLHVFGGAVEAELGHGRFAAFFLAGGAAGSLLHGWLFPGITVPTIGASGAIASILGLYFVRHWRSKIVTLVPFIISWTLIEIPALVFLPLWFGLQLLNGLFSLSSAAWEQEVGVAWWAHIGGFLYGTLFGVFGRRVE